MKKATKEMMAVADTIMGFDIIAKSDAGELAVKYDLMAEGAVRALNAMSGGMWCCYYMKTYHRFIATDSSNQYEDIVIEL